MNTQTRYIKKEFINDMDAVNRRYVTNNSRAARMSAESLEQSKHMKREHLIHKWTILNDDAVTQAAKNYCKMMILKLENVEE